jgi:hypothetical protein
MNSCSFAEYIDFLRANITNLIEYKESTGTLNPNLLKVRDGLSHPDPIVLINACEQASRAFAEKNLYH